MRLSTEHKIFSSFREWFEHTLLEEGRAFFNVTTPLYQKADPTTPLTGYSAPYQQWVYDSSVSGAVIPTATGLSVPHVDYDNGRTLGGAPTGNVAYSVKELNVYTTSTTDEHLIFESKFNERPKPKYITGSGLAPHNIIVPCVFLKPENRTTELYAFGGSQCRKMFVSALIASDDEFKRFGAGSLFADKIHSVFPYFDDSPINEYGDIKSGVYNYTGRAAAHSEQGRQVYIHNVTYTPVEVDSVTTKSPNIMWGKIYFELHHMT
jgi:hypothetical protein